MQMVNDQDLDADDNNIPNWNSLGEFLEILFPELNGGFVEVRRIKKGNAYSDFFADLVQLTNKYGNTLRIIPSEDVYFGVCPRSERKGTKDAIRRLSCVWADVDAKNFDGGKDEALRRIHEFPINPTVIVDSGNGYHVYWRLKESESINSIEDQRKLESYLKALSAALNADPCAAELAKGYSDFPVRSIIRTRQILSLCKLSRSTLNNNAILMTLISSCHSIQHKPRQRVTNRAG